MTIPNRGTTGDGTYFVTASTLRKKALLQSERMAGLFVRVLLDYRNQGKYLLHEFVVMPDHFHLLVTPIVTLERAVQFIKGGFSFRAGKAFGFRSGIWQSSFYDHRVRNAMEYQNFRKYIHQNPVKRSLAQGPAEYSYSSASRGFALDPVPQRLKSPHLDAIQRSPDGLLHP